MEYVEIQGEKVPKLGLGTWQLKGRNCVKSVETALNEGFRHIDTAQAYGNEEKVGRGIEISDVKREEIFLTTKVWRNNLTRKELIDSVSESLEKLGTEYVDLLLVHWPFPEMEWKNVFEELKKVVEKEMAQNIGVSNFNTDQMDKAERIFDGKLFTNQVEHHPFLDQSKVLEKCREQEMMLTAYSPLARGEVMGNQTLKRIGSRFGKSEAQVALRWLIEQENVCAIPKAGSEDHIRENIDIFDFSLGKEEKEEIEGLSKNLRKVNPSFAPKWD